MAVFTDFIVSSLQTCVSVMLLKFTFTCASTLGSFLIMVLVGSVVVVLVVPAGVVVVVVVVAAAGVVV